jgi:hypothetical protein
MKVVIDGDESEETTVDSGVPQGTVLGPLLFLCHSNDLPDSVRSSVRLFAGDCLLYRNIRTQQADKVKILARFSYFIYLKCSLRGICVFTK